MKTSASTVKVADQVRVVTALLHREQPGREDFTVAEIMARARQDAISRPLRAKLPRAPDPALRRQSASQARALASAGRDRAGAEASLPAWRPV